MCLIYTMNVSLYHEAKVKVWQKSPKGHKLAKGNLRSKVAKGHKGTRYPKENYSLMESKRYFKVQGIQKVHKGQRYSKGT